MYIDLRKRLSKVRGWDTLVWDGHQLLAFKCHQPVDAPIRRELARTLNGITPLTAGRVRRAVHIRPCTRLDAFREILSGHAVVAHLAIARALEVQPRNVLTALLADPQVTAEIKEQVNDALAVCSGNEMRNRDDLDARFSCDPTERN